MLREYAVDPIDLSNTGHMSLVLDQFGIPHGRIIAEFPKDWVSRAYKAIERSDVGDVQKKSLVERLKRAQIAVAKLTKNREFRGNPWIDAAIAAHKEKPFTAILSEADLGNEAPDCVLRPSDATSVCERWRVETPPIPRTAEKIAECLGPLGRISSKKLMFIDPYIVPERRYLDVIRQVLLASRADSEVKKAIELHGSAKLGDLNQFAKRIKKDVLSYLAPSSKIEIFKWEEKTSGDAFHARYFLTDRGGINVEHGLDAVRTGQTTDIRFLDQATYKQRSNQFGRGTHVHKLLESAEVSLD